MPTKRFIGREETNSTRVMALGTAPNAQAVNNGKQSCR